MKKNIYFHEKNLDTAIDRYADCTDIKQKTPLLRFCKGVLIILIMIFSLEHWYNPEVHSSVFSWQLILLQRFSTPTINTTHTHHCGIQREVSVLR